MFTAPSTGGLKRVSRLSGAWGWAKLIPWIVDGNCAALTLHGDGAAARPPKIVTEFGEG